MKAESLNASIVKQADYVISKITQVLFPLYLRAQREAYYLLMKLLMYFCQ